MKRATHWINNAEVSFAPEASFPVFNPIDGSRFASAARGTTDDIERAVTAASDFADRYAKTSPSDREQWLLAAADLLVNRSDEFVEVLIDEIGSPLSKARMEVSLATKNLRATAAMARQVTGRTYPTDAPHRWSLGFRKPIGVVAGITPFNVPLIKGIKHSSLPLATGNPFVWLPSEFAPVLANLVARLYRDAGIPAGAFQLVTGLGTEIGDALVCDPRVALVGFTGSHRVGRHLQTLCGQSGKRVVLELGGKNPLVIWRDANLDAAVRAAVMGGFLYQGQICMASSRVIVHEEIRNDFLERMTGAISMIRPGDLRDPQTIIGPILGEKQRDRIRGHLADATEKGATIIAGGTWEKNCLEPTLLTGVTADMRIHREETFGPVVTIESVNDVPAALATANDTSFGLVASVFTEDLSLAMKMADQIHAGMVHINAMTVQQEPQVPFGGVGKSGFGREGLQTGIDDMTEWKWVTINPSG